MASNAENVSIWWRHHDQVQQNMSEYGEEVSHCYAHSFVIQHSFIIDICIILLLFITKMFHSPLYAGSDVDTCKAETSFTHHEGYQNSARLVYNKVSNLNEFHGSII